MKKIGILCFIFLLVVSCENNEPQQRISYRRVSFTVDLALYHTLENMYAYKIYTKSDLLNANEYIDAPGVLIFNNGDIMERGIPFVAYDTRCPYEDRQNATILPDPEKNGIEAVCSVCKSRYDLINFGQPVSGPAEKRLQDYCVSGNAAYPKRLSVRNCM
jgi:nitrite reductase/ring-hydroxylating ferredoxin subunit